MERIEGSNDITHVSAAILFSCVQMQVIYTVYLGLLYSGVVEITNSSQYGVLTFFLAALVLCSVNILTVGIGQRYKLILEEYEKPKYSRVRSVIGIVIFGSFGAMFTLAALVDA